MVIFMRIYFMRHGDYREKSLNSLGKKQVKYSSRYLSNCNIVSIYSSPLTRCMESALIVNKLLKKDIIVDDRLKEREKIASMRTSDDEKWFKNYLNVNYSSKKPEGAKQFFSRIKEFVLDIKEKHSEEENILVVGHSSTLYALAAYFYNVVDEAVWMAMGNGSIVCFEIK